MQNVLNSSPYTQYQPYQQSNPNYYQGKYSQYNNYHPSYYQTPQISTVNWKFINDCNPQMIEANEDIEKMNQILSLISHSDFQSDSQTNQNPNILKLLSLTQVVINYLLKCQNDLKEQNSILQKRNSSIENAMKKNNKSSSYYKGKLIKAVAILKKSKTRERCPTCHVTLQSFHELDQHMKTSHNKLLNEWICIKEGKESPLQKQIAEMQREIRELKTNQRSHYFNDSANANKQKKKIEHSLFDKSNNNDNYLNLSSDEDTAIKQQQYIQPRPQIQPKIQVQQQIPIIQNIPNPDDTDNLAKLNAKKRAEDFLSHRRPATPMHPQQVDEIVHKISNMLHEQSKQVNYGEIVKEEPPEDLRKDISEDVESDHPMPETSTNNNLKDLKKPLKPPRRRKAKKKENKEEESEKETPDQTPEKKLQGDDHCYGDSMPLSSSSLNNSFVFMSEIAQYDSSATPSEAPKKIQHNDSNDTDSQPEQKPKNQENNQPHENNQPQEHNQNSDGHMDSNFHSESGHSKFEMVINDNDLATYEEFISDEESNHGNAENGGNDENAGEEEITYEYEEEEQNEPKVKPAAKPVLDENEEYSYTYEDIEPDNKGYIHQSPQPLNNSLRHTLEEEDEASF